MRGPAKIEDHLSNEAMLDWLGDSPGRDTQQRRMAIWLSGVGRLHGAKVAEMLGVSVGAIRLWIGQYNRFGPAGLDRKGRGGRRKSLLTVSQEVMLIRRWQREIDSGEPVMAVDLRKMIEQELGRKVSAGYVYRMLARHGQVSGGQSAKSSVGDFVSTARPWRRKV